MACWLRRASSAPALPSPHPMQTVAFCGVFPEIKRAWASVDNSLFLWRFDKWCVGWGAGTWKEGSLGRGGRATLRC